MADKEVRESIRYLEIFDYQENPLGFSTVKPILGEVIGLISLDGLFRLSCRIKSVLRAAHNERAKRCSHEWELEEMMPSAVRPPPGYILVQLDQRNGHRRCKKCRILDNSSRPSLYLGFKELPHNCVHHWIDNHRDISMMDFCHKCGSEYSRFSSHRRPEIGLEKNDLDRHKYIFLEDNGEPEPNMSLIYAVKTILRHNYEYKFENMLILMSESLTLDGLIKFSNIIQKNKRELQSIEMEKCHHDWDRPNEKSQWSQGYPTLISDSCHSCRKCFKGWSTFNRHRRPVFGNEKKYDPREELPFHCYY